MLDIFRVDDGASHWVMAFNEEEVRQVMEDYYDDCGYDDDEWVQECLESMTIRKLDRESSFTYSFHNGRDVTLEVQDWVELYWGLQLFPFYFACSEF